MPRKPREWEQILGGSWLARIGALSLIIGVAFFLKFAFENNWLGPSARVILGIIGGLVMIGGGRFWRLRYPTLAQAVTGGGVALLYLSIFAAFGMFSLIPFTPAVLLLLLVSAASAILALQHNSMALAILGIFGAFSAPFLLGSFQARSLQGGSGVQLLVYIMVVDVGVIALSTLRNWRWFTLLALAGSLAGFGVWHGEFGGRASLFIAEGSLTLIFLIFVGATTLYHLLWRRPSQTFDYALMGLNAAAYFGISCGLMSDDLRIWMGGFTLLLALFYGSLAYVSIRRSVENTRLAFFALGIALVFFTIAVPVQLGDRAWTTIIWAAEGTVLMWLATKFRRTQFRTWSFALFAVTAIRLLFFDTTVNLRTTVDLRTFQLVVNERVLAFVFAIAAMFLTSYLLWREQEAAPAKAPQEGSPGFPVAAERARPEDWSGFLIAANLFSLWLVGAEIKTYEAHRSLDKGGLLLILLIVVAGVLTLHYLVWRRPFGNLDRGLIAINALFYCWISGPLGESFRAWMGGLYLVIAIFYASLAYFALKRSGKNSPFGLLALGIGIAFVTLAVPVEFKRTAWTSVAWAVEFVALLWLAIRLKIPLLRTLSSVVFVILSLRLLFFDTRVDLRTFQLILNERFLAYTAGAAAAYLAAYLVWRRKEVDGRWSIPAPAFLFAACFFTIWLLSFEVWDHFESLLMTLGAGSAVAARRGLRMAQNLSLTSLWAVCAVLLLIIGIAKRSRGVRLGALGLLAISIGKVYVYDVWVLERVYRIIAFVGLGVLLLGSAYLYQRYSRAIRGFLLSK
jgi:uncharacterized membrane protein